MPRGGDIAFLNGVLKVLIERRRRRPRLRRAHTEGLDELAAGAGGPDLDDLAQVLRLAASPASSRSRRCTRRRRRPCWSGRWASPSTSAARDDVQAIVNLGAGARLRGARRRRASCPFAATPACRAAPRWAPTPRSSRAACPITHAVGRAPGGRSTASRSPRSAACPRPRWSRRPARGELDVLWSSGGNFLRHAAGSAGRACRPRAGAAARAPGHRGQLADAASTGRRRAAAARSHALRAGRRRHRDHHRAARGLLPGDPAPARRRGAQRVADLPGPGRGRGPGRVPRMASAGRAARKSARRSRASCRSTRASSTWPGPATRSSGAAQRLCDDWTFPTADGKAHFAVVQPREVDAHARPLHPLDATRQAVQLHGLESARPAHRRAA